MNSSNLFVKNIPSIQERTFRYRAPMDSHELNSLQQEAFSDILDLFNKANQLQKTIYEMNMAYEIESAAYAARIEETTQRLNLLLEQYQNITSTDNAFRTITRYAHQALTDSDGYAAIVDKSTNDITAHVVNSTSKIRLYDEVYDETLIPPGLQVLVGPDTLKVDGNIYSIEDSDIKNAFDGKDSTAWFRKIVTGIDVDHIDIEVVIGLPEDIITTRLMNQITIKPFPVGHIDILDIKFKSNGAWETIPGFTQHDGCIIKEDTDIFGNLYNYHAIENCSNVKFNFQNLQSNQVKIILRQRNFQHDEENNRRIWYLGLKDVNVLYNIYTRDYSEFEMIYEFPETDRNIKVYDSPVFFNNSDIVDDSNFGVSKEYFYFDEMNIAHKVSSTCPFILQGHKLKVRYTLEGNQTTPNIYQCQVKYKLT